jgi:hypothetical protein
MLVREGRRATVKLLRCSDRSRVLADCDLIPLLQADSGTLDDLAVTAQGAEIAAEAPAAKPARDRLEDVQREVAQARTEASVVARATGGGSDICVLYVQVQQIMKDNIDSAIVSAEARTSVVQGCWGFVPAHNLLPGLSMPSPFLHERLGLVADITLESVHKSCLDSKRAPLFP